MSVYWIPGIPAGKPPRPVVVLKSLANGLFLTACGTTVDDPSREPPERVHIRCDSRDGKGMRLSRDTWFDRLGFRIDVAPLPAIHKKAYVGRSLKSKLADLLHATAELELLRPDVAAALAAEAPVAAAVPSSP